MNFRQPSFRLPTRFLLLLIVLGLGFAACGDSDQTSTTIHADFTSVTEATTTSTKPPAGETDTSDPATSSTTMADTESDPTANPDQSDSSPPDDKSAPTRNTPTTVPLDQVEIPDEIAFAVGAWQTDFSIASVDLNELKVGIPASDPRDRIPPIDEPQFETVAESDWLEPQEPGVLYSHDEAARFYPLTILHRHEIVNDELAGEPITVTYCPLCNTALVFSPIVDGMQLRFGVSGLLRNSDLVMWDDHTQSLWQQITGEAIVGTLSGTQLENLGSAIVSYGDFVDRFPQGEVMIMEQGFGITYGTNPYTNYSSSARPYAFFEGEIDDSFPALDRVVGVSIGNHHKAYPFESLQTERVVNDVVGAEPIVIMWGAPDTADALDKSRVADARGIGTGVAYSAEVGGRVLTFEWLEEDRFVDLETQTTWTLLGLGIAGELSGEQLELVPHRNEFWFAWQAFFPDAPYWSVGGN